MPFSPEDIEKMKDLHARGKALLTEEQHAENKAKGEAMKTDEAKKQEFKTKTSELFTSSDANGDGALDLAEFKVFLGKYHEMAKAGGYHVPEQDDAMIEERFGLLDRFNPETTGVTLQDYWQAFAAAIAIIGDQ